MVRASTPGNWLYLTLSLQVTRGTTSTILTAVIELLALVFLITGIVTFFYTRQKKDGETVPEPALVPDQPHRNDRQQQRSGLIASFVLMVPFVALLLTWLSGPGFFPGSLPPTPTPRPTPHSTPTKTTLSPSPTPIVVVVPPIPASALVSKGQITVGTDTSYPQQTYTDPTTHHPNGFDIDLINKIGQLLGLKVVLKAVNFEQLLPDLDSKKSDVVIAAYSLTNVLPHLTVTYLAPREVVLRSKSNPNISTFTKLTDLCGHTIGVLKSSNEDSDLQNAQKNCNQSNPMVITELPDADAVGFALVSGTVDATYQDSPTSAYYIGKYGPTITTVGNTLPAPNEGMIIRSGNTPVQTSIQAAFNRLVQNGTYRQLLNNWHMTADAFSSTARAEVGQDGKTPEAIRAIWSIWSIWRELA